MSTTLTGNFIQFRIRFRLHDMLSQMINDHLAFGTCCVAHRVDKNDLSSACLNAMS
jgi:hypothetical protein